MFFICKQKLSLFSSCTNKCSCSYHFKKCNIIINISKKIISRYIKSSYRSILNIKAVKTVLTNKQSTFKCRRTKLSVVHEEIGLSERVSCRCLVQVKVKSACLETYCFQTQKLRYLCKQTLLDIFCRHLWSPFRHFQKNISTNVVIPLQYCLHIGTMPSTAFWQFNEAYPLFVQTCILDQIYTRCPDKMYLLSVT